MTGETDRMTPFLMFEGKAEEAMNAYVDIFPGSAVQDIERWGDDGGEMKGHIKVARFNIAGLVLRCSDSPNSHDFGFTPSFSLFMSCTSEAELEEVAQKLMEGGEALMPPDDYGFSRRFTWVQDRFGVSWQLNLE